MLALLAMTALAQEPAPAEAPAAGEELPIVEQPQITQFVDATWPEGTKEAGEQADVTLLITLDEEGLVSNIEVSEPAGRGFDEAAVDAVLAMEFSPARTAEGPVSVTFEFTYGFRFEPEVPAEEAPAPVNLEGRIREMGTRAKIEGLTVVVDGTDLVTRTDEEGAFELRGVPLGTARVRILSPEHVTLEKEVEVVEGEATVLDLWIKSTTYRDNEIVGVYQRKREEVTRRTISIDEARRIPGTFGDPIKVIQTLPGAARSPFGTGLLVIRGSNPEDSAVYVDGVRIPIIYHLTGQTSVLSPDIIESVDYLPGGYGPQYGRSMGGVVDVKTKREFSEQGKLVWGTDILDSQLYFEGQLGKKGKPRHQLAIAGRRSYIDLFIPAFTQNTQFKIKPRYQDYQIKYIAPLPADQKLSAFVYGFEDILTVSTPDDFAQGTDQDTQGAFLTKYSTQRLVLNYQKDLSDTLTFDLTPSFGTDAQQLGLGDAFRIKSRYWLGQLRSELRWTPAKQIEIIPGVDFLGGAWTFEFDSAVNFETFDDPLAEREPAGFQGTGSYWNPDLYLKANLRPFGGSDRWLITPGVRAQFQAVVQAGTINEDGGKETTWKSSVNPRLSSRFEIVEGNTLKAATGLYTQPPQPQEAVGIGGASQVGYERAWNTSVGFEQRVSQRFRWDVDFFYKTFDQLVILNPRFQAPPDQFYINGGTGRAYGMELIARHEPVGRFFGWVSYTLSRSERKDAPDEEYYAFDFDQTHIFSAQGGYDLPLDIGLSAQIQYVTGNPTTPLDAGIYDADSDSYQGFSVGARNADRLPAFFQTSVRVDRLWTFKRWQLETYVDLLNVVRGVNPEFRQYNYDFSDSAFIRGLPFIPNIGLEARFYL